nr:unnamed protein product [Digitaria exilis]
MNEPDPAQKSEETGPNAQNGSCWTGQGPNSAGNSPHGLSILNSFLLLLSAAAAAEKPSPAGPLPKTLASTRPEPRFACEGFRGGAAMVWFQCEDCGENLKKPKLAGHFRSCSAWKLSCIDCGEFFSQDTVQGHTQCISEANNPRCAYPDGVPPGWAFVGSLTAYTSGLTACNREFGRLGAAASSFAPRTIYRTDP